MNYSDYLVNCDYVSKVLPFNVSLFCFSADCWFPGCVVVSQHPLLSLLRVHLPPHADQPAHSLWLHGAVPHQPLQDLLLQITFLAPQAAGQSTHLFTGAFLSHCATLVLLTPLTFELWCDQSYSL